jgi:hypothetical protein
MGHDRSGRRRRLEEGDVQRSDRLQQRGVGGPWIVVDEVVELHLRRDFQPDAVCAHRQHQRLQRLGDEANTARRAATIGVGAQVGAAGEELHRQVARAGVQFDAVETGLDGQPGGLHMTFDHRADLAHGQRTRRHVRPHAGVGVGRTVGPHRRGRDGHGAAGQQRGIADATGMHELRDDAPTGAVHRVRDLAPGHHVARVGQPGCAHIALAHRLGPQAFGDDQAGARALGIVGGRERADESGIVGATACHRCHDEAVGQPCAADGQGGVQVVHGCFSG